MIFSLLQVSIDRERLLKLLPFDISPCVAYCTKGHCFEISGVRYSRNSSCHAVPSYLCKDSDCTY